MRVSGSTLACGDAIANRVLTPVISSTLPLHQVRLRSDRETRHLKERQALCLNVRVAHDRKRPVDGESDMVKRMRCRQPDG